ncbi:TasA family protein [Peribacillus sp. B-H-3]|uniref:TasA family protein n=1 Tax=Peribacillus sp. B-H-3 TaxID=3400420 RepID=UPI003B0179D7
MGKKAKAGLSIGAIMLAAALTGGGTFAFFSDSVTQSGSTFTAGVVKIEDVSETKGFSSSQYISALAPGDSETNTVTVKNTGNLDVWVRINEEASNATKTGALFSGETPVVITYDSDGAKKLAPNETATFKVTYEFPLKADKTYQEAQGKFDVVFDAVQSRNNDEGNGPKTWN